MPLKAFVCSLSHSDKQRDSGYWLLGCLFASQVDHCYGGQCTTEEKGHYNDLYL